jgi:hypothetical protein
LVEQTPYLAEHATVARGFLDGHTIYTAAVPETSDEQDPPPGRQAGVGTDVPWLALAADGVPEGELSGQTIYTKAGAETADEGDEEG